MTFGSLRVLNEDRVAAGTGFPAHPHRDAEIFSYIISGELTHRDSMLKRGQESKGGKDDFFRMKRGDVQFTTGGTGIAHSEQNESNDGVHFLQIWALPWKKGLTPRYHTQTFDEAAKKKHFVPILSPLKAGVNASTAEETEATPSLANTIPIHADLMMGAGILSKGETWAWGIGGTNFGEDLVKKTNGRRIYLHLAMTSGSTGKAKIRVDGREELGEGDGCYVEGLRSGDKLTVESFGVADAEIVILDSD